MNERIEEFDDVDMDTALEALDRAISVYARRRVELEQARCTLVAARIARRRAGREAGGASEEQWGYVETAERQLAQARDRLERARADVRWATRLI